jgi:hypothetical protein
MCGSFQACIHGDFCIYNPVILWTRLYMIRIIQHPLTDIR